MKANSLFLASLMVAGFATAALAQSTSELRIGMRDDPGSMDPATNATFVGRVSLQSICDKLVDIDSSGALQPMLATSWEWSKDGTEVTFKLREGVTFHDGTPFNAEAVKWNLNRYQTMDGSRRRPEIAVIKAIDVLDKMTVKLTLKAPSVSLLVQFTDRAGMMVSPTAYAATTPDAFAKKPICAGPYKMAEFKPQERIVLDKFPNYWRADKYHFDHLTYYAMPDTNIRLLNLRSNQLDLAEYVAPNDIASVESDPALKIAVGSQPAYEFIQFNLTGPNANPDFANHVEVRQAFSLALDRRAINDVVFSGRYDAGNQPFPPSDFWYNTDIPVPERDVEKAKALMAKAGVKETTLNLLVSTSPERIAVSEIMQSMLAEVGIKLNIVPTEFVAMRSQGAEGRFQAYVTGSSGRPDPDLNISLSLACGVANNVGKYCNQRLDELLAKGRALADPQQRKPVYAEAIKIILEDTPGVYLFNPKGAYALRKQVNGFVPYPDGIIRLDGVNMSAK